MDEQRIPTAQLRSCFAWGLAWGTAEATLGHILHWLSIPGLAGIVMAPIGVWAMARAINEADRPSAAFAMATLAAAVKMADILLPGRGPVMALRPALAILAEGLIVSLAFALAAKAARPQTARRPA
ncbi:MAG: hypothetical protein NTZ26_10110 [Candidatus Aminicenantes bacterium]|nr:hypothetical protein [Candidatus Aminicenantes bacterium]